MTELTGFTILFCVLVFLGVLALVLWAGYLVDQFNQTH